MTACGGLDSAKTLNGRHVALPYREVLSEIVINSLVARYDSRHTLRAEFLGLKKQKIRCDLHSYLMAGLTLFSTPRVICIPECGQWS